MPTRNFFWLIAVASALSWTAWAQTGIDRKMADFAWYFARLATTIEIRTGRGDDLMELPLARWEHPITWTLLGDTSLTMRGAMQPAVSGNLLSVQVATKGHFKARYMDPTVLHPSGRVLADGDIALSKPSPALIAFQLGFDGGVPRLTTRYETSDLKLSTSANLTILFGDRSKLNVIAQSLPSQSADPVDRADLKDIRCQTLRWSSGDRSGLGSAVIMIDDQLSTLERGQCLDESVGRALGIRGRIPGQLPSLYSKERNDDQRTRSRFDTTVLSILYDPRIQSGMSREAVVEAVEQMKAKP